MHRHCKRCEGLLSATAATCPACGFAPKVNCGSCGHANPEIAVFCGGCGQPIGWRNRLRIGWRRLAARWQTWSWPSLRPWPAIRSWRTLGAGVAFGMVLGGFAFGTMGMVSPGHQSVGAVHQTEEQTQGLARPRSEPWERIERQFVALEAGNRDATYADLVKIGMVLLGTYQHLVAPDRPPTTAEQMTERYLAAVGTAWDLDAPLRREEVAVFFFKLFSDLFELRIPDSTSVSFNDVPRFHYLNIPLETLDRLGLRLGRNDELFGASDRVTVDWLRQLIGPLYRVCEVRLKIAHFPSLDVN